MKSPDLALSNDLEHYVAWRSEETVALAEHVIQLTERRKLELPQAYALLAELQEGAAALAQLVECLDPTHYEQDFIDLLIPLQVTWQQMADVVQHYTKFLAASAEPPRLRLVSSRSGMS